MLVNVGFYSEFPTKTEELKAIFEAGAVGFKLFMAEQVGGLNLDDEDGFQKAFIRAGELGSPIAVHAEDHALLRAAMENLKLRNRHDISAYLKAHDENVELTAVERLLGMEGTARNAHIHFCHVSTQKAIEAVAEAKKSGKTVTCEVTPHHLLLKKDDYERLGSFALTMPPLRTQENIDALWKGIEEGTVDTIGSDHAPHTATGEGRFQHMGRKSRCTRTRNYSTVNIDISTQK